jgi:hypothetical protein
MQQQQLCFSSSFCPWQKRKKKTFVETTLSFAFLQLAVNYEFFAFHGPFSPQPLWCTGAYHIQRLCLIPHPLSRDLL